jgi:hypothetical protein
MPQRTLDGTMVENSPALHLEGYSIPANDYGKFDGWFNQWAARVYIPFLLKIPGVRACNFFKLLEEDIPDFRDVNYVLSEMPRYIFEKPESVANYYDSLELAAFKRSLDVEFSGNLKTVWETEYQLFKSYRP